MRCAITGATGHVGSSLVRYFQAQGWEVCSLGRRPHPDCARHLPYALGDDAQKVDWSGINALVHCAYDFHPRTWREICRTNVAGSIDLLRAAQVGGVARSTFISSMSAFPGCRSLYGRAKLEIETAALELGAAAVRPGLVWADKPGSLLGSLEAMAKRLPVLPLIGDGGYLQYLVFDEDLARLVFELSQRDRLPMPAAISAAHPQGHSFRAVLERLAARHGRSPIFVPIPWPLIYGGLKAIELLGLSAPFRSDSLVGIVFQNPAPQFELPPGIETSFRPFA